MDIFKLEAFFAKYAFLAEYFLCCSEPESLVMSEVLDMANFEEKTLWDNLDLGYTEYKGLSLLRQTIARELYSDLDKDNILTFAGAEEGIFCALSVLIESRDHVIVLTPCYQSLFEIPKSKGADITKIQLKEENQWRIDLEDIKSAIKTNTKCIVINFPHNPTGQIIEENQLKALIDICKDKDIWIFSDEVYMFIGNQNTSWTSAAACLYNKALSLGVMSKAYGMAGVRIGWIACQDKELLKKVEYMKHYTSTCNSAPSEILSVIALNNKNKILKRNNQIVADNLAILNNFFTKYQNLFEWICPQGGCIGFVRYKKEESVDLFCDKLVRQKKLLLLPSSVYDFGNQHFRIGFGQKDMPECLDKLNEFLSCENI